MNALMCVEGVRHKFAEYLNAECAYLTHQSVDDPTVAHVMKRMQDALRVMLFLQVITPGEADSIGKMMLTEVPSITLPEVTSGRFGMRHEWDLQATDASIIKKYWRARITACGAKLVQEYQTTNDICKKHEILDIIIAGITSGRLTGTLSPSECKQLVDYVNQARQKLSGGLHES